MATRSWGHRERLLALCGLGALIVLCGAVATAAGAAAGPGVALTGTALCCWELIGLWMHTAYRGGCHE
ncbi:hypothetical protein ABTY98_23535 [Streptomyces sp. NPDC096040]|uniref:hypothetical protein n=1 Tax=Streptomyces sp. NPDC096040 TaxID=3155541 RepID=UPI0033213D68